MKCRKKKLILNKNNDVIITNFKQILNDICELQKNKIYLRIMKTSMYMFAIFNKLYKKKSKIFF